MASNDQQGPKVDYDSLSPDEQKLIRAQSAEKVAELMMSVALTSLAQIIKQVDYNLIMSCLQGAHNGLNRALGVIGGDILENLPPDFKTPDGKTGEQVLAEDANACNALGKKDRKALAANHAQDGDPEAEADKAVAPSPDNGRRIGFRAAGSKESN